MEIFKFMQPEYFATKSRRIHIEKNSVALRRVQENLISIATWRDVAFVMVDRQIIYFS